MVFISPELNSKPSETLSTCRLKAEKFGCADEQSSPKAGMDTAIQAVLDNVVLVDFFHNANQFFSQVGKTSKT